MIIKVSLKTLFACVKEWLV